MKLSAVQALAETWASMDGKSKEFESCRLDPAKDEREGHYQGYMAEAESMIKRLQRRGFELVKSEKK